MYVTQDVILDLLPLYLAGEASPATRVLVEAYLKEHPDIGERVRHASGDPLAALPPPSAPPDLEMQSLRRTMRLLTRQRWLFAVAIWLTCAPFMTVITFPQGHMHLRFLINDYPVQLGICAQFAVWCWLYYFYIRYRVRTKP